MALTAPVSIAAAADLLALYGIIEVPTHPAVSAGALVAAGTTIFFLCLGLLTGWHVPAPVLPPEGVMF